MRMKVVIPVLLALLAACASGPPTGVRSNQEVAAISSEDEIGATASLYRETVRRSELLGRALFENDVAAAFATKLLLDSGALAGEERIIGWITQQGQGSLLVTYVAEENGRRTVGYEIVFPGGPFGAPTLAPTPSDTPLAGERAVMYTARETAVSELQPQCNTNYNPVVLPASLIGQQGWLVYMLAANLNPGERVLAGHSVTRVSADGLTSMGSLPLSQSCQIEPIQLPQGTEPSGIFLVHRTTAWPLETHVYTSLINRIPVYVQTSVGTWTVDGDTIELINLTSLR